MRGLIFIFMAVFMVIVFLDVYFIVHLLKSESVMRDKLICAVMLMSSGIFLTVSDFFVIGENWTRLSADLLFVSAPFVALANVAYESDGRFKLIAWAFFSFHCLTGMYYFLSALSVLPPVSLLFSRIYAFLAVFALFCLIVSGRFMKLRKLRNILLSANMEDCLNADLDIVYYSFLMIYGCIAVSTSFMESWMANLIAGVTSAAVVMTIAAISMRIVNRNHFIFASAYENRLLSSTCVTPMDLAKDVSKDKFLKDVYLKVLTLLNKESLYLNPDVTIRDVASRIGSNKNYVSKAVLMNSGKNFCQFLNYYRVAHAVRIMQLDPRMKIGDLYASCGFNSHVSFAMAFRLYMKMSPSDWLQMERKSGPRHASKKVHLRPER